MNLGKWTYLVWLLGCGLPVALGQWLVAPAKLRLHVRRSTTSVLFVGTYLSVVDQFAIKDGIWRFSEEKILGIRIGYLPIEEGIFFYLSSLLVVQSLALFSPDVAPPGARFESRAPRR